MANLSSATIHEGRVRPRGIPSSKLVLGILAALVVVGVMVWQAVAASGNPDPAHQGISRAAIVLSTGVLVPCVSAWRCQNRKDTLWGS